MFGSKHTLTVDQVGILVTTTKERWRVEKGASSCMVNSHNHKIKEVMQLVRAWVGLLLQYNIHWVARTVFLSTNNNHPFSITTQVQPLVGKPETANTPPQQVLIQDWDWLLPIR